ncbi:MAG: hypothetical protein ACHQF2_06025 [Flavobacteriales bacterium]
MISIKIIFFSVLMAIMYGILHDMVTAHICVEYFTIGHPKIIESESPFVLALTWGTIATWWVGLPMGILIALFSRLGKRPKLELAPVMKLVFKLMSVMFVLALLAGIIGFILAENSMIHLISHLAERMGESVHTNFLAVAWAHMASYISGIIGTFVLCRIIYVRRKSMTH